MGVTYAKGTEVNLLDPVELGKQIVAVVQEALPWLEGLTEEQANQAEKAGQWSAKEIIGHLVDSAVNNLARIVRMQYEDNPDLPGYDQNAWVKLQRYSERLWPEMLALWLTLNEHLASAVRHIDKAALARKGTVAGGELTLGFLVEDYIAHMEHHLRALKQLP
ncbi:MAG TPA: DinB family protein [Edaphobacter sp.]|nr:DinB family protein [Edaphobacter sp.]